MLLLACATYAQALLDDATIGKLVKAGIGEQTIVSMIKQQPGRYALSPDDMIALKKSGIWDAILQAMIERNGGAVSAATTAGPGLAPTQRTTAPTSLDLHDGTPIRLRLARDVAMSSVKPTDMVDFEILDDLRIDGMLVIGHGVRVNSTAVEVEAKTRMGRGGKSGLTLEAVPLVNGDKVSVRVAKTSQEAARRTQPMALPWPWVGRRHTSCSSVSGATSRCPKAP